MPIESQTLRVIGGQHRGRRLEFRPSEGLRPTTDRVRETLFNWLQPVIVGARCLDMFSGSGLLGIEALSRGAGETVFIEQHPDAVDQLQKNINTLGLADARIIHGDVFDKLASLNPAFDVVFIDPPFTQALLINACQSLHECQLLRTSSRVYLECEQAVAQGDLPVGWEVVRNKQAGQVFYYLVVIN